MKAKLVPGELGFVCRVSALAALCWVATHVILAADPRAGLPPKLDLNGTSDLSILFTNVPLPAVQAQAQEGSAPAQAELGRRYRHGIGVATNIATALEWIARAATNGLPLAQGQLGYLLETGGAGKKDLATALYWYRQASGAGLTEASHRLGWLSANKASSELDPKDSLRLYELAAEQGDAEAACSLARLYFHPPWGGSVDSEKATYWYAFAASRNYVPAYSGLGWCYMSVRAIQLRRVDPDYQEAERWFRIGAEQGDPECQYGMAMVELNARPDAPDLSRAREWLLKAAAGGNVRAFYQLGRLAELHEIAHPPGAKPDYRQAAEWYEKAADANHRAAAGRLAELTIQGKVASGQGVIPALRRASDAEDMNARVELAARYIKGEGSPRNAGDEPLALLQSARAAGNTRASLALSELYQTGKRVPRDLIRSVDLLVSAASGVHANKEALEKLYRLLRTEATQLQEPEDRQLRQALEDYRSAVYSMRPDGAVVLARRYLDGTYPADPLQAAVWYSLAGRRKDEASAAEALRLTSSLDSAARAQVDKEVTALIWKERQRLLNY